MTNIYSKLTVSRYKDKSGKNIGWRGSLSWRDAEGKRKQTTKVCHEKLKRDAVVYLEEWHKELEKAAQLTPQMPRQTNDMPTVTDAITSYINYQLSIGEIEKSTYSANLDNLNMYISPYIGNYVFTSIDTNVLNMWIAKLFAKGLSQSTIRTAFGVVRKTYGYYYYSRKITENPCEFVKPPKKGKPKTTYLDDEQIQRLLTSLQLETSLGDSFRTCVLIALYGGLRREEICGLRWYDVDFDANQITISTAIGIIKQPNERVSYYTKEPKTPASKRQFPMIPALRNALLLRKRYVEAHHGTIDSAWFVVGEKDKYIKPPSLSTKMYKFSKMYDIREHYGKFATFHGLRHNFATIGVNNTTMDIASLAQVMGHASKAMTLDTYSTATKDAVEVAMQKMGEAMNFTDGSASVQEKEECGS